MSSCSAKGGDMWQTQPTLSQHHRTVAFNSCNLLTVWLTTHDWRSITSAAQTRAGRRDSASRLGWSRKWSWEVLSDSKEKMRPQFRSIVVLRAGRRFCSTKTLFGWNRWPLCSFPVSTSDTKPLCHDISTWVGTRTSTVNSDLRHTSCCVYLCMWVRGPDIHD